MFVFQSFNDYQQQSHTCKTWKQLQALFERSCGSCPVSMIQKFLCKIDHHHSAYNIGLTGPKAQRAMKEYSSHHQIPRASLIDVHVMSG
ncbi:hypothetical protein VP01_1405g5 [Puccinia sorghi]|uniref:Uncharacterized protein n=1 Tax=Puccinia sorghi TaxID=27349 RepID=A0A0L6VKW3_9BASI|nr:hypothetical protein VP01_1405g5 [Puccinia sorghi]